MICTFTFYYLFYKKSLGSPYIYFSMWKKILSIIFIVVIVIAIAIVIIIVIFIVIVIIITKCATPRNIVLCTVYKLSILFYANAMDVSYLMLLCTVFKLPIYFIQI